MIFVSKEMRFGCTVNLPKTSYLTILFTRPWQQSINAHNNFDTQTLNKRKNPVNPTSTQVLANIKAFLTQP